MMALLYAYALYTMECHVDKMILLNFSKFVLELTNYFPVAGQARYLFEI